MFGVTKVVRPFKIPEQGVDSLNFVWSNQSGATKKIFNKGKASVFHWCTYSNFQNKEKIPLILYDLTKWCPQRLTATRGCPRLMVCS